MPSIVSQAFAATFGLLVLATTGPKAAAPEQAVRPSDLAGLLQPLAASPPRLDQHGARITAETLHDRLVIVSFVNGECTVVCAVRTLELDKLARALPERLRERVRFVALGTDPARDDAGRLRALADGLVGPTTPLRFLGTDAPANAAVMARLHYPERLLPEPPPTLLLFDRRGELAMTYGSDPLDAPRLLADLTVLETFEDGVGRPPRGAAPTAGRTASGPQP
ncbi:SCO family protein [Methylorubrum salsuginis]|uniref:SCO1/SenC n=1 Tax=Methylorubrum salsuginis TaxID=414703 RepID=A0A1I4DXW1_9HYPH|nr:SCO family protein [Methylorubrum salsuginis]SFK96946.1 SCO1/SenC [Methylorubrum salsuginis]